MSDVMTKKQRACKHPIESVSRVEWARGWALFCVACNLRFSPTPEITEARRAARDAEGRLNIAEGYWRRQRDAEIQARDAAVIERDQARKELKQANEHISATMRDLSVQRATSDNLLKQIDRGNELRIRETNFLRGMLLKAIELVQP